MREPGNRVATDADARALTRAASSELPDGFISQRAAARNDTDVAFFVDVTGRDADAAATVGIFSLTGRDNAGTIRADEPHRTALQCALHPDHVAHGNAFGNGNHQFQPGIRAFQNRVGGKGCRNKNSGGRRAGLFHRLGGRVENGDFLSAVLKDLAALAGGDAGNDLRAVINRELRVPRAEAAGDALDEDFGVGLDENGHGKIYDFGFTIYDLENLSQVKQAENCRPAAWKTIGRTFQFLAILDCNFQKEVRVKKCFENRSRMMKPISIV